MADEDKTVYIGIELDRQSQSAFNSSLDKMRADLVSAFDRAEQAIRNDTSAVDDLRKSLTGAAEDAKDLQEISSEGGGFGGGGGITGLRRTGGALTQLGLGEIGRPVMLAGDIAQVGKEFGQITEAVKPLIESLSAVGGGVAPLTTAFAGLGGSLGVVAAAAAPVAIAIAGVAIAWNDFQKHMEEGKTALDSAVKAQELYYKTIQTGTTTTIKQQIASLESQKAVADALIADLNNQKERIKNGEGIGGAIQNLLAAVPGGPLDNLNAQLKDASKNSTTAQNAIDELNKALNSSAVAANDAAEKEKELAAARIGDANKFERAALERLKDQDMADKGEVDAAKKKVADLKEQYKAEQEAMEYLLAHGDRNSKEVRDQLAKYYDDLDRLGKEIDNLDNVTIPAAESVKKMNDIITMAGKAADAAAQAEEEAAKVEAKKRMDMASAVQKADADETKIKETSLQKQIDIERKYQDALVQAAQRAAQQAEDELRKLHDQQAQLTTNYQRGELSAQQKAQYEDLTAQIKGQEEQAKAYREHWNHLQDIQRNAQQQQAQFLLDRNFLGLFQNQLTTRNAMENENLTFGRTEQERSITQQQAANDAQRQRAFERQQRLEAYQQANADAQRQYQLQLRDNQIAEQRAIAQARQAKTVELNDLSHATSQALSIRHQGLIAELQLITQGEQQKLAIQAQFYQRAVQLLRGAVQSVDARSGGSSDMGQILHHTALQTNRIIGQTFGVRS